MAVYRLMARDYLSWANVPDQAPAVPDTATPTDADAGCLHLNCSASELPKVPIPGMIQYSLGNQLVSILNRVNEMAQQMNLVFEGLEQLIVADVACSSCRKLVDKSKCEVVTQGLEYQNLRTRMGCYSVPESLMQRISMFHAVQMEVASRSHELSQRGSEDTQSKERGDNTDTQPESGASDSRNTQESSSLDVGLGWQNIEDHAQICLNVSNIIGHKNVGILRTGACMSVGLHSYAVIVLQNCWVSHQ